MENNFETNYRIGEWFTFGYVLKTIENIRKDKNGHNEYLLDNGNWVTGKYITFNSD